MRVRNYSGDGLSSLKKLLDNNSVEYFYNNFEYGGFMYENFEGDFLLPYSSKEVIDSRFFGLFKDYKYEVTDLKSNISAYLTGQDSKFFGGRDLKIVRDILKGIKVVEAFNGELELNIREFSVVRDIIMYSEVSEC